MARKTKICFIDLDGTLIETRSGKTFPTSSTDWKLIPDTAKFIKNKKGSQNYKIVLVTNQGGISKGYVNIDEFKQKLFEIQSDLKLLFDKIFIATSPSSKYRKPKSAALELDLKKLGWEIDKENSFMIGDAGEKPRDFSDSDFKFAESLGIEFIHTRDLKNWD